MRGPRQGHIEHGQVGIPLLQVVHGRQSGGCPQQHSSAYSTVIGTGWWGARVTHVCVWGWRYVFGGTGGTQNKEGHTLKSLCEVTPRIQSVTETGHALKKGLSGCELQRVIFKE